MRLSLNRNNIILYTVLFSMILPVFNILGFGMPIIYFLTPIGVLVIHFIMLGRVNIPSITKPLIIIWSIILLQILITTLYSTVNKLGFFVFPTDIFQYIVRFVFLISFIIFGYKGLINKDKFIKYFMIILIIGMSIGVFQWIPWPGREFFVSLYSFRDGQEQISHLSRPLHLIRVHGFAQHATANGGIASFALVFAYSVRKYYGKYGKMGLLLLVLSIINIFASQARAGMLAAVFSIFLLYLVNIKYERKGLKPTLYFMGTLYLLGSLVVYLYNIGNVYIMRTYDRWINLFETGGGTRATTQPQYFFSLMENTDYLFGLSKPIINRSAISYGIEIEPVNIFVTYGATGFILQYTLIAFLLIYFYKKINKRVEDKAVLTLTVASFVGLFGYQIFSVAYFFFREIRIGLFPWILMGVTIGLYERYKSTNLVKKYSKT